MNTGASLVQEHPVPVTDTIRVLPRIVAAPGTPLDTKLSTKTSPFP